LIGRKVCIFLIFVFIVVNLIGRITGAGLEDYQLRVADYIPFGIGASLYVSRNLDSFSESKTTSFIGACVGTANVLVSVVLLDSLYN
tara:strand:+ start:291 stop:551 length:261 start_codon:yes stop_codon:yes gene_type:complete